MPKQGVLYQKINGALEPLPTGNPVEFIRGTQTAATPSFTGVTKDNALYDGKRILYWLPYAGGSNDTLNLTLSGGTATGDIPVYYGGTTRLTTHYGANNVIPMTYNATNNAWYCDANYYTYTQGQYLYNYNTSYFRSAVTAESLAVGDSTGYVQAASGISFDISYPILWITANIAAGGTNYANTFIMHYDRNLTNLKSTFNGTAKSMVYLIITLAGKTATIDSEIITCTLPSTENGKLYLTLGRLGQQSSGKNYFILEPVHPIFYYKAGAIHEYAYVPVDNALSSTSENPVQNKVINTALAGKAASKHTHNTSQITISGNGTNIVGGVDSFVASVLGHCSANKLFGMQANEITIEYSNNGGTSWTSYPTTDSAKRNLVSEIGSSYVIGGPNVTKDTKSLNDRLRITLYFPKRYCSATVLYIWMSTLGNTAYVNGEYKLFTDTDDAAWKTSFTDKQISGWSGPNVIYVPAGGTLGGNNTWGSKYLRLTFKQTALSEGYSGAVISDIRMFGTSLWYANNIQMLKTNTPYTVDPDENIAIPKNLSITGTLTVSDTATFAKGTKISLGRIASANQLFGDAALRTIIASSSMTTGKPVFYGTANDATVLHMSWDNTGGWDSQLAITTAIDKTAMAFRNMHGGTWHNWETVATMTDLTSYLPLSGGTMTGTVKWNSTSLPNKTGSAYAVVIDAFASGGEMGWRQLGTGAFAVAYSHPTTSGNKHIPSGGSSGQILVYSSDGTATWGNIEAIPDSTINALS